MNLTHSDQINDISKALAAAQKSVKGALKDAKNPHFKSSYADLASVWEACRDALTSNDLAVVQSPSADGVRVTLDTMLVHASGQWMRGTASAEARDAGAQAIGSIITYLRRYALQSFVGVAPADDDAEAAEGRGTQAKQAPVKPAKYDDWLLDVIATADNGMDTFNAAFKAGSEALRSYALAHDKDKLTAAKIKAQQAGVAA